MNRLPRAIKYRKANIVQNLLINAARIKYILILIFLLTGISGFSQADHLDSLLNDLVYNESDPLIIPEKPASYHFLYAGTIFNSKTMYAGREIGEDMINISGHLYYYTSWGLFAGASGRWFDQLTPGYNNTTLSIGFSKGLGEKKSFTFRSSYSRYIYTDPVLASLYPDKNNISLGLKYHKKWFGSRLSGSFLFGEGFSSNLAMAVYSRFTLVQFGNYNKIYTSPEVSFFLGPETVSVGQSGSQAAESPTNTKEVFGLLTTQLYAPVGISVGDFDFEFSCTLNIPRTQDASISYPATLYYTLSVGYMLPIAVH